LEWWVEDGEGAHHLFGFDGCRAYLLGTDALGRDMLSRALFGARWSVSAAALGVTFTVAFGTLVGAVSGFVGGLWDRFLMRMTELVMALPAVYLVLAVRNLFPDDLSAWQASFIIVGSLAAVGWCSVSRLLRGQILTIRENEYVASARAVGATGTRVLFRHVLPNAAPFILLQVGIALPYFLLGEATLSYLGLGIPEPEPSWGNMLSSAAGNYTVMTTYWWTLGVPGLALTGAVLAANLWVEGLRRTYLGVSVSDDSSRARWGSKHRRHRAS
jgi:peptide/nickel transport system permease protein